jgi:hypothetical protein
MSDDPVVAALIEVAKAMYPAVYAIDVHNVDGFPDIQVVRHLYREQESNPAYAIAAEAIRSDPDLAPLIESDDGLGVIVSQDTGRGWRFQSATQAPDAFVRAAARHVLVTRQPTETIEPLLSELSQIVPRVRRLMQGQPDQSIFLTAFDGLGIPESARVDTPWGTLRAPSNFESSQRLFGGPPATAILETRIPIRWHFDGKARHSDEYTRALNHADLLSLAAVLALGRETEFRWIWQVPITPVDSGMQFSGAVRTSRRRLSLTPPPPPALDEHQLADLGMWAERVAQGYDASIAVAVRRVLSAVSERATRAEDALLDAVIAWENLFGAGGTSETTFRVTTALALLLEPDRSKRSALRTELGKIYEVRSKVAHGAELKPKHNLDRCQERAIEVAIDALRILFRDRPHLIAESKQRAMRVILGLGDLAR